MRYDETQPIPWDPVQQHPPVGIPPQPSFDQVFVQEGAHSQFYQPYESQLYPAMAPPGFQQHAIGHWQNHQSAASYTEDVGFDELQTLNTMGPPLARTADSSHTPMFASARMMPVSSPYAYDATVTDWAAHQEAYTLQGQIPVYQTPPGAFVLPPQPPLVCSQSPVTASPATAITAISPSPTSTVEIGRSVSPPRYEDPPPEPNPLYKTRLQEILHTMHSRGPQYTCTTVDGGFTCLAVVSGQQFQTSKPYKSKKLGHYAVAYEALRWLEGSHNHKLQSCTMKTSTYSVQSEDSGTHLVLDTRKRRRSIAEE